MSACDLTVVIVNWNVRDLLRACLASIYTDWRANPDALEVIVVDNASSDGSAAMVRTQFPQAILIENPDNPGFATANNQAIRQARGRYVMLLNPDTEVLGGAFGTMIQFLEDNPTVGMVAPQAAQLRRHRAILPSALPHARNGVPGKHCPAAMVDPQPGAQ